MERTYAIRRFLIACVTFVALLQINVVASAADADHDGLDDQYEHKLLERYRPYYAFASNETFRPTDILFYLQNSDVIKNGSESSSVLVSNGTLRAQPDAALTADIKGSGYCSNTVPGPGAQQSCLSSLLSNRRQTNYRINPLAHPPGASTTDPGRHGADWPTVVRLGNVGLYGHVVPIHLSSPTWDCHTRWKFVDRPLSAPTYVKVEYWQFYGYSSEDQPFDIGDHEGDWTSIQLLIKPRVLGSFNRLLDTIVSVMLYAHGLEFRFDLKPTDAVVPFGGLEERRGINYGKSVNIGLNASQCDKPVMNAQNNVLRFFRDPSSPLGAHPVVYPERGGHENWPTTSWSYQGAQKHDGTGPNLLTATPPNLGEVENPLGEYAAPRPILQFNGLWGAYSRDNTPPPGPPLHGQWTWPDKSSIGWLLPASLPY